MELFWWNKKKNWGDLLSPLLLNHFAKVDAVWSPSEACEIVSTGSVLDLLPVTGYRGIVAGTGTLHASARIDLREATVLGIRGRLTARCLQLRSGTYTLGDPGLLASELVPTQEKKYPLGVIPHWTDDKLYTRELNRSIKYRFTSPHLININQDPIAVIKEIASCERVITSSLHGVIVADSFRIPRRVEKFDSMFNAHEGGTHKFDDYASSIDQPIEWGKMQLAPRYKIEEIQSNLFKMFKEINATSQ